MRRKTLLATLLFIVPLVIIGLATVEAEHEWDHRYTISGKVTDGSGSTARGVLIGLNCDAGKSDESLCGHNAATTASSGLTGRYELTLHLHGTDHDGNLVLTANGEEFTHTIDMQGGDGQADEVDRFVEMDIKLNGDVSPWSYLLPRLALLLLGTLTILFILKNRQLWIFKPAPAERVSRGRVQPTDLVPCPRCSAELKRENLFRHLTEKHSMQKAAAEALIEESSDDENGSSADESD